jgi:chromosome segregation ATPase
MDVTPKSTNPKLKAFDKAQQDLNVSLKELIDEKNALIANVRDNSLKKQELEESIKKLNEEKTKIIVSNDVLRKELRTERENLNKRVKESEIAIQQAQDNFVIEKETEQKRLAELLDVLEAKENKLYAEDKKLTKFNEEVASKETDLVAREDLLLKEKEIISGKETILDKKIAEAVAIKNNLDTREEDILDKEAQLHEEEKDLKKKLNNFQEVFTNKTAQIEQLTKGLERREEQYKIRFKGLKEIETNLKKREIRLHDRETVSKMNLSK